MYQLILKATNMISANDCDISQQQLLFGERKQFMQHANHLHVLGSDYLVKCTYVALIFYDKVKYRTNVLYVYQP